MDGEVPSGSDSEGGGGRTAVARAHAIRASVSMRGCLRGDQRRATSGFRRRGRPVRELFPLRARQLRRRGARDPPATRRAGRRMTRVRRRPGPRPVVAPAGRNSTHPLLITAPRSAATHTSIYSRHRTIEASENRPREQPAAHRAGLLDRCAPGVPSFPGAFDVLHPQLEPGSSPPPLAKFAASTTDDGSPDDASPSSVSSWYSAAW